MYNRYSIYDVDKEDLIDSVSKSTLYYQKYKQRKTATWKESMDLKINKFGESIKLKIID